MSLEDGYYSGEIEQTRVESNQDSELIVCFDIRLDDDPSDLITCEQRTEGEYKTVDGAQKFEDIAKNVFEHLGLEWPKDIIPDRLAKCHGKRVRVRRSTKQGRTAQWVRYYIVTKGGRSNEPASDALIKQKLAKFSGEPDVPF